MVKKFKCPNCEIMIFKAFVLGKEVVCDGFEDDGYNVPTCYVGLPQLHTCKESDEEIAKKAKVKEALMESIREKEESFCRGYW